MSQRIGRGLWVALAALLAAGVAHADRRYFVHSYTSYLAPAGTLEFESWTVAASGQGDSANTAWQNRAEFEYAISDRLTGAAYLNFVQPGGEGAQRFDGPSLELIYRLAEPGRMPLDPAVYLEVRENGDELEVEPKLLLAGRRGAVVSALNLVGEVERHHRGGAETEKRLRVTWGVTRELGVHVALGMEALYDRDLGGEAGHPAAVFAGPTINLQSTKLQLALGWQPQWWGDLANAANLDLDHFPRAEFRMILGVDL